MTGVQTAVGLAIILVWVGVICTVAMWRVPSMVMYDPAEIHFDSLKPGPFMDVRRSWVADAFADARGWRQGFFGDLAFRLRLFFAPDRVVEVLNAVEAANGVVEAFRPGDIMIDERLAILRDAGDQLRFARFNLREFVFGEDDGDRLADIQFDGPEECALVIDRDESDLYVDRSGVVRDSYGRALPNTAIITYGRQL